MLTDDDDDSDDDEGDDDDNEKNNNSTNINKRIQKGVKFICNNNSFSSRNKNSQAQTAHRRMCVVENEKKFDALQILKYF